MICFYYIQRDYNFWEKVKKTRSRSCRKIVSRSFSYSLSTVSTKESRFNSSICGKYKKKSYSHYKGGML